MADPARRPISSGAIIAITFASTLGLVLVIVGFVAAYISAYTVHPVTHRFAPAEGSPSCAVSGHSVVITYPIGEADPIHGDEVDWARPDQLKGFTYVGVTTSLTPPDQANDSDP